MYLYCVWLCCKQRQKKGTSYHHEIFRLLFTYLFTGSVKACKGSVPGNHFSLRSNSFDGVTFRLTVVEHDEQLGWTGLGDL